MKRTRYTSESYNQKLAELTAGEYALTGEYINTCTKTMHKHITCGYEWEVRPNDMLQLRNSCPSCSQRMHVTQEEMSEILSHYPDLEMKGEYDYREITIHCKKCDTTFQRKPSIIKRAGCSCRICAKGDKHEQKLNSFRAQVFEVYGKDFTVAGYSENSEYAFDLVHNACKRSFKVRNLNDFIEGLSGCPHCKKEESARNNRKSYNEKYADMVDVLTRGEYEIKSDIVGSDGKIVFHHRYCGTTFASKASNFKRGTRCPYCTSRKDHVSEEELDEAINKISFYAEYKGATEHPYMKKLTCKTCGETFELSPGGIVAMKRCPNCNPFKRLL